MDLSLLETLNGYAARHDSLFEDPLRFVSVEAPVLFIVLLAALFLANGKLASRNARHGVVAAGFSTALALGIAQVVTHLWARPRPYVAHPGDVHLFIPASMDTSFPSDHATAAFAIAVAIFLRSRRAGWLALAMAALVSIGRVVVGTHYATDVLAGAAIGTLSALVFFHPRVRGPLHALADRVGAIYDGLLLRRPQTR
jgi:undecaprenyl-diphosphatase